MTRPVVRLAGLPASVHEAGELTAALMALRQELGVPEQFPPEVVAAADRAAASPPGGGERSDATGIPFVTIDPPGCLDLDQALHIERRPGGYRVRYAIADVAAFVSTGDPVDLEAHRRGETLYSPDTRAPLYPASLGEGAASLLPGVDRPALLWSIELDGEGRAETTQVDRARVKSRARLDYATVQSALDAGTADEAIALLPEVGRLREEQERQRGGVSLPTPEQKVVVEPGGVRLEYRAPLPVEGWNAQVSLLTGMQAAALMIDGGVGLLRTLPPPDPGALSSLRRSALALGEPWPEEMGYADFIRGLDPERPTPAALLQLATRLLRGAGYTVVEGGVAPPEHSAVAAPYAHATAPLRRLADRYVGEVCVALCAGRQVPDWARAGLAGLATEMEAADDRAHRLVRAVVDLVEAVVLAPRVGEVFEAVVVDVDARGGMVQLREPAVRARCVGPGLPLGHSLRVRLVSADPLRRKVEFAPSPSTGVDASVVGT